jgi:hypothetical protein
MQYFFPQIAHSIAFPHTPLPDFAFFSAFATILRQYKPAFQASLM